MAGSTRGTSSSPDIRVGDLVCVLPVGDKWMGWETRITLWKHPFEEHSYAQKVDDDLACFLEQDQRLAIVLEVSPSKSYKILTIIGKVGWVDAGDVEAVE